MSQDTPAAGPAQHIAGIVKAADTASPESADSFGAESLDATIAAAATAANIVKKEIPKCMGIFADDLTEISKANQAMITFREAVAGQAGAARIAGAESAHSAIRNLGVLSSNVKQNSDAIIAEVTSRGKILANNRGVLSDYIAAGHQILSDLGAGGDAPAEEGSYADRLGKRLSVMQTAFNEAADGQIALRTAKKGLIAIQDLAEDLSDSLTERDREFIKLMGTAPEAAVASAEPAPAPAVAG